MEGADPLEAHLEDFEDARDFEDALEEALEGGRLDAREDGLGGGYLLG